MKNEVIYRLIDAINQGENGFLIYLTQAQQIEKVIRGSPKASTNTHIYFLPEGRNECKKIKKEKVLYFSTF